MIAQNEYYPLISIIIPVYNGAKYLREAIDSALVQTYDHCEVIVVNDGSDDNGATAAIAESYGDRIIYIQQNNGGVAAAMNAGIRRMNGEYFSWLSHDDWYEKDKICKQLAVLQRNPGTIVCTGYSLYLESKKQIYRTVIDLDFDSLASSMKHLYWPEVIMPTMLIPKKIWESTGGFDERYVTVQDYEFVFKMLKTGVKFIQMPESLVTMRHHADQGTLVMHNLHIAELEGLYCRASALFLEELATFSLEDISILISFMKKRTLYESARRLEGIYSYITMRTEDMKAKPFLWLYWENKPGTLPSSLIKICWKSIYLHCEKDFTIINLDEVTVTLFLRNLHTLWRTFEQIAHRADYIRFMLLEQYGGIWLDSDHLLFRSLLPVVEKIKMHGFVCTAYAKKRSYFALICFLASVPHNTVVQEMLRRYHAYMNDKLARGRQPAWDELGGRQLGEIISPANSHIYEASMFHPVPVYCKSYALFLPPGADLSQKISGAFGQGISYSVIGALGKACLQPEMLARTNFGVVYSKAFGVTVPMMLGLRAVESVRRVLSKSILLRAVYHKIKAAVA